jgi:UDPglucose 6-dehydrogenase
VRYSLEPKYRGNRDKIKECDIVFIAVPTPTGPAGFSDKVVRQAVALIGEGKIAVIKSTILPGTTESVQKEYPRVLVLNSPEFLSETTAARDVARPFSNIVGVPGGGKNYRQAAKKVLSVLPSAKFAAVCTSRDAELIKYIHNGSGYVQIIFFNLMYDLARAIGGDWRAVERAIKFDPFIPNRYASPVHHGGRGAGGHCFIKDIEALFRFYRGMVGDTNGTAFLEKMIKKNIELLTVSGKSTEILREVYGRRRK